MKLVRGIQAALFSCAALGALTAAASTADATNWGSLPGYTLKVKLVGGTQYEKLYTRIPEWEKATGAKVEIVSSKVADGQAITVGFRAEAFSPKGYGLHGDNEVASIERTITLPEPLGTETLLYTELDGKEVQGKMLNPRPVQPGEQMTFNLDLTLLHVFNKASGKSVLV